MMRETGSQLTQQAVSTEKERYPLLGNTVRPVPSEEQIPVSRFSASYKALTKNSLLPTLNQTLDNDEKKANGTKSTDDPFRDGVYDCGPMMGTKVLSASQSNLSAGAAAVENSGQGSRPTIEPRQTRTSSLRARLSAGQLVKDEHSKVVGFTDFTAPKEPAAGPGRRDSLRARKEAQTGRSVTPPAANIIRTKPSRESTVSSRALAANTVRTKSSRESIGTNRAPAQFVGGSRRPVHPRRPSSRGSLRNEPRASTPPLIPSRPAPLKSASKDGNTIEVGKADNGHPAPSISPRKSSIPVPRPVTEHTAHANESVSLSVSGPNQSSPPKTPKKEPRSEQNIYEERLSVDLVSELGVTQPLNVNGRQAQISLAHYPSRALDDIEESPQHAYQLKRLSVTSPNFGPTLKISPSADRFIMGPGSDKESRSLTKKKSKELDRVMIKDDAKTRKTNTKPASASAERPSSSQGLSRLTSRVGLIDPKFRENKAKSADLSQVSALEHVQQDSMKPTSHSRRNYTDSSAKVSKASTNTSNDPFFDAPEEPLAGPEDPKISSQAREKREGTIDEAAWISPLKEKRSVPGDGDFLVSDGLLPAKLQRQTTDGQKKETKLVSQEDPFQTSAVRKGGIAQPSKEIKDAPAKTLPFTPSQNNGKHSPSSGSYPPRSSSRIPHHEFTSKKSVASSTPTTEKPPPTPPKDLPKENDFRHRQNNLGSLRGHESSQMDLSSLPTKRDSAARDSYKSQASVSKGMLSNFRGLFHKRSAENEPLKSGKKSKTKVSITANGNPFPHISDIHPIYRPTLASINRSNAATPRPSMTATPATPSFASPIPTEVSQTTSLAMQILEDARNERSSPKKERLLELGRIMVDAITQARDAEKAMEEAKHAARKAEVANALCKKSLGEVEKYAKEWSGR